MVTTSAARAAALFPMLLGATFSSPSERPPFVAPSTTLGAAQLASIDGLKHDLWNDPALAHLANQSRSFGQDAAYSFKGHAVNYVHTVIRKVPGLLERLQEITESASAHFGISSKDTGPLAVRCVEHLSYFGHPPAVENDADPDSDTAEGLGYHTDVGSLLTMSVMLSEKDEYTGGSFELVDDTHSHDVPFSYRPGKGEILVWQAWKNHRVTPVTSGERHVLVLELW